MPTETFEFFVDREVEQIWVWSDTVRLVVDSRQSDQLSAYVDVHSDSVLTDGAKQVTLDVRNNPDEAGAVLRLLHDRVVGAVSVDGVLHLSFAGGAQVTAPPDEQYESWTVAADGACSNACPEARSIPGANQETELRPAPAFGNVTRERNALGGYRRSPGVCGRHGPSAAIMTAAWMSRSSLHIPSARPCASAMCS
jgi:hypothetical protein